MTKAIKLTQEVKDSNSDLFKNKAVGDIFLFRVPKSFTRGKNLVLSYDKLENLQTEDGIKELINPVIDLEVEKLTGNIINVGTHYEYEKVDLTQQEIDERIESKLATEVPRLYFSLQLVELEVDEVDVLETIKLAFQNNLITKKQEKQLKLKWEKGNVIERSNTDLFSLIPLLNQYKINIDPNFTPITEEDITNIFKTYNETINS